MEPDLVVLHSSPPRVAEALRSALSTQARGYLVILSNNLSSEDAERIKAETGASEVLFFTSGSARSKIMNALLRFVYHLDRRASPFCSAVYVSRPVAELVLTQFSRRDNFLLGLGKVGAARRLKTSRAGEDVKLTVFIRAITGSLGSATLSRFIAVGVSGTILNEAILGAQVSLTHIDPSLAVPLAFEASMAWNFALNDRYTFHGGRGKFIRLIEYNFSSIGSFLTQFAAVKVLTDSAGINYLLSSLIGIGTGFFVNYYFSTRIWKPRE